MDLVLWIKKTHMFLANVLSPQQKENPKKPRRSAELPWEGETLSDLRRSWHSQNVYRLFLFLVWLFACLVDCLLCSFVCLPALLVGWLLAWLCLLFVLAFVCFFLVVDDVQGSSEG